ncbi:MAG: FAD-dependent oxidoreductase [Pseudomonadota bacterium]
MSVTILGTGLAGYTTAREIRKLDADVAITLITADDGHNYSKPMLSNGFAKGKTAEGLKQQSPAQMAEALGATVLTDTRVTALDTGSQTLVANTDEHTYDKLVLAIGAQQIRLPLEGDGAADVVSVNTLWEYAAFRDRLDGKSTVAVMGPGLIGCEFANDLCAGGLNCHVIGPDAYPLERLMPPPAGHALQGALETLGARFHLGTVVNAIHTRGGGFALALSNGEEVLADVVLSAAGLVPDTALARAAGIDTARGIVVDRCLRTSAPNVYALGDCIEIEGRVMPYVMPIMHTARALASAVTGNPAPVSLPAMPVAVKTPVHPIVVSPPAPDAEGQWHCETLEDGGVKARFESEDGALLGLALTGAMAVKQKVALQRELPPVLA